MNSLPLTASSLYAKNLFSFIRNLYSKEKDFNINLEDEIIDKSLIKKLVMEIDPFIFRLSIFILSIFIGYYVVWSVTPSLHTPRQLLMPFRQYYCRAIIAALYI